MQYQQYIQAKKEISEFERLQNYKGYSVCPFCGGTKTRPFIRPFANQDCNECNEYGAIENKKLAEMDLGSEIKRIWNHIPNETLIFLESQPR